MQQRSGHLAAVQRAMSSSASPPADVGEVVDAAVSHVLLHARGRTMSDMLAEGRAIVKRESFVLRSTQDTEEQLVLRWFKEQGPLARSAFASMGPSFRSFAPHVFPCVSGADLSFQLRTPLAGASSVARAISMASRQSNINRAFALDWVGKHRPIMHQDQPPITETKAEVHRQVVDSLCQRIGFCACGPEHSKLRSLRKQFYDFIRVGCRPRSRGL